MPGPCVVTLAGERLYPYREPGALSGHRRRLLHKATGDTLDLSARWTRNQACFCPGAVSSLHVMAAPPGAARPLEWADDPVTGPPVVLAGAPRKGGYDTVVAAMTLCETDRLEVRLAEIATWLRPGGHLLALEHVCGVGLTGIAQRLVSPVALRVGTSCRLDQDLAAALRSTGFELTDAVRFTVRVAGGVPVPCMAAVARTPARP
jgi:hypothetical protein